MSPDRSGKGSQNRNNRKGKKDQGPDIIQNALLLFVIACIAMFVINYGKAMISSQSSREVSYDTFYKMVEEGEVESVIVGTSDITIVTKADSEKYSPLLHYYTYLLDDTGRTQMLLDNGITVYREKPDTSGYFWDIIVGIVLPFACIFLFMNLMMRRTGGGGVMGVGKSNAKVYMQKDTGVTFADVAGEDEAKESLIEIVDFLHNPAKYRSIGAKLPKGALLVGPPGTGKTLLAKAVAGEAEVPFFSLTGSDFVEMFVGVGASRVRDLFKQANQVAPCIVFIDEIDAIGKSRDSRFGGGNDEREQTLNQLLSEMDGFDPGRGIMVLGATNRPEILDPALLRAGRFDRRVIVEKPDLKGRVAILKVHSKDVKLDKSVDFEEIGLATSGAVGADLANMINEAAITAVKNGRRAVSQADLFEAVEVVLVGKEKKDRILSKEERRIVSYHEVGHALIAAIQKDSEPVQKITIVPRTMGALGYVMQVPEEEKYLNTQKELEAMLVTTLGGRAAEELVFDTVTTGAANDIEKATDLAKNMITRFGMSEKFGLMALAKVQDMYLSGRTVMDCGDQTATEVDREVKLMLDRAYTEARKILSENMTALHRISAYLIEKETITGSEFMEILARVNSGEDSADDRPVQDAAAADGAGEESGAGTCAAADTGTDTDTGTAAGIGSGAAAEGSGTDAKTAKTAAGTAGTEGTASGTDAKAGMKKAQEPADKWAEAMKAAHISIPDALDDTNKNKKDGED